MNVDITKDGGATIIKVEGRIDTVTAKEFETKTVEALKERPAEVIIDCGDLAYVSSSGLRVFLILQKSSNSYSGKLRIINMNDTIKKVFEMTGFASILTIE